MLEEFWRDEKALERHLQSEDYRKILLVVEMALSWRFGLTPSPNQPVLRPSRRQEGPPKMGKGVDSRWLS
jgi:hypothetical protein